MIPDAECIRVVAETLEALDLGPYVIKLNHRCILDGIFAACGIPSSKFRSICSAVDKLDKNSWEEVKKEMVEEKGLDEHIADKVGRYVSLSGGMELIAELKKDKDLIKQSVAVQGLDSMELLLKYCGMYKILDKVKFDLSLARGLDYYTGVIYEAVLCGRYISFLALPGRKSITTRRSGYKFLESSMNCSFTFILYRALWFCQQFYGVVPDYTIFAKYLTLVCHTGSK